jgi:hypothetical protein
MPVDCNEDCNEMPSSLNGHRSGFVCRRCGFTNVGGAQRCAGRDGKCQSWLPGNAGARTSGIYATQQPIDLRMDAEALTAGIVADLGGLDELSTLERAYVSTLGDVTTTMRLMINDMIVRGFFTPSGNPRRVCELYLSAIDRFDRLGQRVGLKRRARKVASLAALLASAEGDAP